LIVALAGCTNRSRPGGGSDRAHTFTIDGPAMTASIKQGETQTLHLKLNRGGDFNEEVKLKVDAPPGIDVVLSDSAVKPTEKSDVNLKVAVGNAATPGEHVIHVTGTPDKGAVTTLDLKVKVTEATGKDANTKLTLKGPLTTTTMKQGETKIVKVSMDREPKYLPAVKIQAEAPKGLRAELANDSLKAAEGSEVDLRITADKNAPIGEHTIQVTGRGDAATVTPVDVKVKVVAP
jgi:uncharacterized membrane protein